MLSSGSFRSRIILCLKKKNQGARAAEIALEITNFSEIFFAGKFSFGWGGGGENKQERRQLFLLTDNCIE